MAVNIEKLSPAELQALIAEAQKQIVSKKTEGLKAIKQKVHELIAAEGLTPEDVFPQLGKGTKARAAVAPKYHNPENPEQTWSGRGKRPLWFVSALKRPGVTEESLLIDGASAAAPAPAKAAKKAAKATKAAKAAPAKRGAARKK